MALSRREQQRLDTEIEIKQVARQQMAEVGAAALSLRGIAREMGMSAPALYRYFPNKDALVTALIIEAFTALADAMERAQAELEQDDFHGRFQTIAFAFREWAMQHPQDFTLIYGTPIPGYKAPREQTLAPAARVMRIIGFLLNEAAAAGKLTLPGTYQDLPPVMADHLEQIMPTLPAGALPSSVVLTMSVWTRLYGVVWAELYDHILPGLAESAALYQVEVAAICSMLGLSET